MLRLGKKLLIGRLGWGIGRAVTAIVSVGLAADTDTVQRALGAKFPVREFPVTPGGMALPQATGTEVEHFIKQLETFKAGAGAGPTGLRPQFIKELVGVSGDDPCVDAMHQVAVLFAEGRVPKYLRKWYGGGTLIGMEQGRTVNPWMRTRGL